MAYARMKAVIANVSTRTDINIKGVKGNSTQPILAADANFGVVDK
jgi:hypothetical protein